VFADGGGRELAYVAMSRARQSTHIWTVADDLPQAADDLRRDWSTRRTPTWALDSALPDRQALTREQLQALPREQQARVAALFHAETALAADAIVGICLPDRAATLAQAEAALNAARQARADLDTGDGVWQDSDAGRAVTDLAQGRHARQRAEFAADHADRWRDRRAARKEAGVWAQREVDAQERWDTHVAPAIARLDQELARHQASLDRAGNRFEHRQAASRAVIAHGLEQHRYVTNLSDRLRAERNHLDGVPSFDEIRRGAMRAEQLNAFESASQHQQLAPHSPGIEM
jgi:hypothetical protein